MKRLCYLIVTLILSLSLLTACQEDAPKVENNDTVAISQSERTMIEQAIDVLANEWEVIAVEDECNNGYLEIKNTRIVHTDSDAIADALGIKDVEHIVEFIILTDFYGAAPYYYETQYMNNVVFFADGSTMVVTNAVQMYSSRTYDAALKNCSFTVLDCNTTFNKVFDLEGKLNLNTPSTPTTENNQGSADIPPTNTTPTQDDYKILDAGRCNENVAWEIRSNGTLYIYGNGTVPNYESRGDDDEIAPWRASAVRSEITDVVISDGITGFGEQAFYGMNLSSIYFGHDVITYDYAVGGSMAVKTVYIPSAMKDVRLFLADSYHEGYQMKIYYEGSKEEWDSLIGDRKEKYSNYIVNFNFEY